MKPVCVFIFVSTLLLLTCQQPVQAQQNRKYPALLWEITGNGLKKPSYLFGTMHVSSKLAFHLSDSFYFAVRSVDMVALELDPQSLQDDVVKNEQLLNFSNGGMGFGRMFGGYRYGDEELLNQQFFVSPDFELLLPNALAAQPEIINNLLYRSYRSNQDFEEDTFLDLYIYQVGKKLGKRATGLEDFVESRKLINEAGIDMLKDKKKTYSRSEMSLSELQDAYRSGNLDFIDSFHKSQSTSAAYDEKFLYRRNEIQANSIDSILKKQSLFAGVGAAHLPGERGVIEILRRKGYKLRPVFMTERDSRQKEEIDQINVTLPLTTQYAKDSLFSLRMPGSLYRFGDTRLDRAQFADMVNGAYYMVTRLNTQALLRGLSPKQVLRKVDSLLYENIPGKILEKKAIIIAGYSGYDINNRTRRGDLQRYRILVTPFEILIFRVGGTGDYVKQSKEVAIFFDSMHLRPYRANPERIPAYAGFTAEGTPSFRHTTSINGNNHFFEAYDSLNGNAYVVIAFSLHNYQVLEEDTFELSLMEEAYRAAYPYQKKISTRRFQAGGYHSLESLYKNKDGSFSRVRYFIKGAQRMIAVARGVKDDGTLARFTSSFAFRTPQYPATREVTNNYMHFKVRSPFQIDEPSDLSEWLGQFVGKGYVNDMLKEMNADVSGTYLRLAIRNDTTGDAVSITFSRRSAYYDTANDVDNGSSGSLGFIHHPLRADTVNGMITTIGYYSDTNSTRLYRYKGFEWKRNILWIEAIVDSIQRNPVIDTLFASFAPFDIAAMDSGVDIRPAKLFLADINSKDSLTRQNARKGMSLVTPDSTDLPQLKSTIASLPTKEMALRKQLISLLSNIPSKGASDYLFELYQQAGDTADLQQATVSALLGQRTDYAYSLAEKIFTENPPLMEEADDDDYRVSTDSYLSRGMRNNVHSSIWEYFYDSLQLTRKLLPQLLPLLGIEEYKSDMMRLIRTLNDSNLITGADYATYRDKFFVEARYVLRKQQMKERQRAIRNLQEDEESDEASVPTYRRSGNGNRLLINYAGLLIPFWDKHPPVPGFFEELLASSDEDLRFNALQLLIKARKPYPDSLVRHYAGDENYVLKLYTTLKEAGQLKKLPPKLVTQDAICRSFIQDENSVLDTLVFLRKTRMQYGNKKGWVYIYKLRRHKEDDEWTLVCTGLQPEKATEINTDQDFLIDATAPMNTEQPLQEQIDQLLKQVQYSLRRSARYFFVSSENEYAYSRYHRDDD